MYELGYLKGKTILVTGGTGSIGKALVREILKHEPHAIRVLSRDEYKQYCFSRELGPNPKIRFFLGDIRDKNRLRLAMDHVDFVFNAAALKQVPSCEFNPFEAVKTNVVGTQNLIDVAMEQGCQKVILVSTDKVVNPVNTMGTTKLLAEKLMRTANLYKGPRTTIFSCVRFGNVIGTRGSVIPLFLSQILNSSDLTLTHPDMTRFVMTLNKAILLVLRAGERALHGETFILKMPAIRVLDLVDTINTSFAKMHNLKQVNIQQMGIREGEKLHEELLFDHEVPYCTEEEEMLIVGYQRLGTTINKSVYKSEFSRYLSKEEILDMLVKVREEMEIL